MNRGISILVWLAALGIARLAGAQTVVTLDDALQRAMVHNPALQAASAASEEAAARVTEARSDFFPRVSFADSWQRSNDPVFVFGALLSSRQFTARNFAIDQLNSPDSLPFYRASLAVGQTLFDGGRTRAAVEAAGHRRTMAASAIDQARADLALGIARVYGRVLTAQTSQLAAASAVAAVEADVARAEHRRDAGAATDADVLAVSVHLADVRQRAIQSAGDAAIARAELNRLMGAAIDEEYRVDEPRPAGAIAGEPAALFAEADAASPAVARARAAEQLAEAGARAAQSTWWPQVSAQAGFDSSGTRFGSRTTSWVAGGGVSWSISTGGAESARVRAASAAVEQARATLDDARAAVRVEVVTALRQIESARARADVGRAAVAQTRERQRILRDRYEAGLVSVNDVLQASAAGLDAESQRISAAVEAIVSDAMLRHALGRLAPSGPSR